MKQCTGTYHKWWHFVAAMLVSFSVPAIFVFHHKYHAAKTTQLDHNLNTFITKEEFPSHGIATFPNDQSVERRRQIQKHKPPNPTKLQMPPTKTPAERRKKQFANERRKKQLANDYRWNIKNKLCTETGTNQSAGFVEVQRGTLVYSAWFDNRKTQKFFRVLILSETEHIPPTFCHFKSETGRKTFTSLVEYYFHSQNNFKRFGTIIGSCVVHEELESIPCSINISTASDPRQQTDNNTAVLPVGLIDRRNETQQKPLKYGICIPVLHGQTAAEWLIEFLELSQILAASHVTFYNFEASNSNLKILNFYEERGLVSVLPWNLPDYINRSSVHYFGQPLAIMDCLYRSMSLFDFVAFTDLDELIVPLKCDNMTSLLQTFQKTQHSGFCINSAIFDPSWEDNQGSEHPLLTQQVVYRAKDPVPRWRKCVVDPRRIFEQGIHRISKLIEEKYTPVLADWNKARVFHYRRCQDPNAVWQPRCSTDRELDKTMLKFGERLWRRFANVKRLLKEFIQ